MANKADLTLFRLWENGDQHLAAVLHSRTNMDEIHRSVFRDIAANVPIAYTFVPSSCHLIAPIYAGMAIYFTWVDHGRPNVWQLPQFFKRTGSLFDHGVRALISLGNLVFDYRFIPSLGDL